MQWFYAEYYMEILCFVVVCVTVQIYVCDKKNQ